MNVTSKKLKELNFDIPFTESKNNDVELGQLNGNAVFIVYYEDTNSFRVFDGGFTTVEALDNFSDGQELFEKVKQILEKYKINKEDDILFIDCYAEKLRDSIQTMIFAQNAILYE